MAPHRSLTLALPLIAALAPACMMGYGGDFGITPGGAQDIGHARALIEAGRVPARGQFAAEGLFSEHDIATPGLAACDQVLCPRASVAAIEPVDGSGRQALVHLAFATSIGPEFERAPLNVAAVVDISGSMSGDKIASTLTALHSLVDQLDADDRMSLVTYGHTSRVDVPSVVTDDAGRATLHKRIAGLRADGGTNMEDGLALGFTQVEAHRDGPGGREDRIMLFTDARPNIGATSTDSFLTQVQAGADVGVGISVFGVGLDLGDELSRTISEVRGGNSFFLGSAEAIATVFDADFDMIVTPVAYSLRMSVAAREGFAFTGAYGFPDAEASSDVELSLATAFLSKRGGAMAVLLDGDLDALEPGDTVAEFTLEYETVEGQLVGDSVVVEWFGGDLPVGAEGQADHAGVAKLAVLLDEVHALEAGADACAGALTQAEAIARIDEAASRLADLAELLDDQPLRDEAELMDMLAANVEGC